LGAQHIHVEQLRELLSGKGLGRTGCHVTGVMDQHVDAAGLGDYLSDRSID
jgi:hypothetical protein